MDGKSRDIKKEQLNKLKKLFPEAVTEGRVDLEMLKAALGEEINTDSERYVLNWAGKAEAFRMLQQPTTATLAPAPKESVNFDATENVFIEGENLEVLKILQKSYYGKIKMIYIDPPYNTGNDSFIYPDKFAESKEEYLKRIGEKDEDGYLLKEGLFRKNSKENGQFHSVWLSMMYPRLFLARNLLRDDGVIFISIDDNEVHNLRMVMNEIFGEENFVASVIWEKKFSPQNDARYFSDNHDYILVYSKNLSEFKRNLLPRSESSNERYENLDNDPRGPWMSSDFSRKAVLKHTIYEIILPSGRKVNPPEGRSWLKNKDGFQDLLKDNRVWFGSDGNGVPRIKRFLSEVQEGLVPLTIWKYDEVGHNQEAVQEVKEIFDGSSFFDSPKPVRLIDRIVQLALNTGDIAVDFFSGTATLAHSILEQNSDDNGNRKFICIQLPEKCDGASEAFKAGYKTIADIGKERIRRVIKNIKKEIKENKDLFSKDKPAIDLGFKVFKLKESNFKVWRSDVIGGKEDLEKQMAMFREPVKPGAEMNNMVWELLIKNGYELTTKVEERETAQCPVFVAAEGELVICLSKLTGTAIKEILKLKPKKVICLDSLFEKNDKLKTNTALQMKDAGVEFKTI